MVTLDDLGKRNNTLRIEHRRTLRIEHRRQGATTRGRVTHFDEKRRSTSAFRPARAKSSKFRSLQLGPFRHAPILFVLGVFTFLSTHIGCTSKWKEPVSLNGGPLPNRSEKAYSKALSEWTRRHSVTVLRDLNTTLRVYATLRSPAFSRAYIYRQRDLYKLAPAQVRGLEAQVDSEWTKNIEFYLVAATHDISWNDFERKHSQWRVSLRNDRQQTVTPTEIRLQRRTTAENHVFLPHLKPFYHLYHVKFPRQLADGSSLVDSATKELVLRIAGPMGRAELVWRFHG